MITAVRAQPHRIAVTGRHVDGELHWTARCEDCGGSTTELPGDLGKRTAHQAAATHRDQTSAWVITAL